MKSRYKLWLNVVRYFVVGILLFVSYTALKCYISDSEFWAVTVSKELFNFSTDQIGLYYKIPFYLILNLPHWTTDDNLQVLILSRVLFALLFCGLVIQLYRLALLLSHRKWTALLYISFLLGTTYFVSQGFRIRSDVLSTFCFVSLLHSYFTFRRSFTAHKYFYLKLFGWNLLMILSTPKSIYFSIILSVALLTDYLWGNITARKEMRKIIATVVGTGLFIGILAILCSPYRAAWSYFVNTANDFKDFTYVKAFVQENGGFTLALISSLIWGFSTLKKERQHNASISINALVSIMAAVALVILLFHNHRLPFFIASLLPILALPILFFFAEFFKILNWKRVRILYVLFPLFFLQAGFTNLKLLQFNNNYEQFRVLREIEGYLSQFPKAKFYDVIGLLPKIHQDYAYVSPNEKPWQVTKLRKVSPDIIVYVGRGFLMEPLFSQFLQGFYLNVGTDFWVKSLDKSRFITDAAITLHEIKQIMLASAMDSDRLFAYEYRPGKDMLHQPSNFQVYDKKTKKVTIVERELIFSTFENLENYQITNAKSSFFSIYPPHRSSVVHETGEIKRLFAFDRDF